MNVIETRDLSKAYGPVPALDRLTLAVGGGAVGLLGPNGAGKSSLVKLLLGLVRPSSGAASLLGLDCARQGIQIRQQVGYMPENDSFIPGLDAVSYVRLAGRLIGMSHADAMQRTHTVLNYVGLDDERYRKVETYSTGMKQKVKFAQALVHHPKLLLLDEPTAGLDPAGRDEMLGLIRDVSRRKGIHVVLSTHILPDVEATCDDVVILDRGRMIRQGALAALKSGVAAGYDVRIHGDPGRFTAVLEAHGATATALDEGGLRVVRKDGAPGTGPILRAAVESGVQLRRLGRSQSSLEELFTRLVSESRGGANGAR